MKPVVLAVVLTGLMSVTALAGNIPTNDVVAPGTTPTSDCTPPSSTSSPSTTSTSSSVALANLVLTIVTLVNG